MEEQQQQAAGGAPLCANGCGFFGSEATKNLCSKCYRDHLGEAAASSSAIASASAPEPEVGQEIEAAFVVSGTATPAPALPEASKDSASSSGSADADADAPALCANDCGFYGSAATKNLCSKCYRDYLKSASSSSSDIASSAPDVADKTKAAAVIPATPSPLVVVEEETVAIQGPAAAVIPATPSPLAVNDEETVAIQGPAAAAADPDAAHKIKAAVAVPVPATPALATKEEASPAAAAEAPPAKSNRCMAMACQKKVGLLGFSCRCGGNFCSLHRFADKHACTYDFKKSDQEKLAMDNPVVMAPKIAKF